MRLVVVPALAVWLVASVASAHAVHYDLRGRADLPLAALGNATGHGTLTLPAGATWLVLRTGSSPGVVIAFNLLGGVWP